MKSKEHNINPPDAKLSFMHPDMSMTAIAEDVLMINTNTFTN